MARALRLEYAGAVYHVTSRGDRREDIYEDDRDRLKFLDLFAEVCDRYNWECHCYCLMSNHYHLVVEAPDGNLSQGMRQLNGVYAQMFNKRHNRVGHVFQGRYKAILVEKEAYLLELSRYVVLNPVRAKMVDQAKQWPWSSYRASVNEAQKPIYLNTDWVLSHFGSDTEKAIERYKEFVCAGIDKQSPWSRVINQAFLGSSEFIERGLKAIDTSMDLSEIPRAQRRGPAKPISYYRQLYEVRNEAIIQAYKSGAYTMKQIGVEFDLSDSMISRVIKNSRFKT
ncbi:MAG: transposase [Gammaproteobacteria bacterium]|nr:transposase [Gammaproteobacteria bacterium]